MPAAIPAEVISEAQSTKRVSRAEGAAEDRQGVGFGLEQGHTEAACTATAELRVARVLRYVRVELDYISIEADGYYLTGFSVTGSWENSLRDFSLALSDALGTRRPRCVS